MLLAIGSKESNSRVEVTKEKKSGNIVCTEVKVGEFDCEFGDETDPDDNPLVIDCGAESTDKSSNCKVSVYRQTKAEHREHTAQVVVKSSFRESDKSYRVKGGQKGAESFYAAMAVVSGNKSFSVISTGESSAEVCSPDLEGAVVITRNNQNKMSSVSFKGVSVKTESQKPHICQICNKGFVKKKSLTRHMYNHTGQYPFWCPFCHAGFDRHKKLNKHLLTDHE